MPTEHAGAQDVTRSRTPARPPRPPATRAPIGALVAGLVLTLVALAAPIVDQLTLHTIEAHLQSVYAGSGASPPAPTLISTYLVVVGLLGVAGWLVTIRAARRGRRWTRPVATALLLVGTAVAVLDLTISEYGAPILPPWLGVLGLLPCVPGLVAVVLLHRRTHDRRNTSTRRVV